MGEETYATSVATWRLLLQAKFLGGFMRKETFVTPWFHKGDSFHGEETFATPLVVASTQPI